MGNDQTAAALLGLAEGAGGWLGSWLDLTGLPAQLERRMGAEVFARAAVQAAGADMGSVAAALLTAPDGGSGGAVLTDRIRQANEQLIEPLSERELEVIRYIATGLSNREIADQLVVELSTVKKHLTHIYGKLEVLNRAQAILRAHQLGLV